MMKQSIIHTWAVAGVMAGIMAIAAPASAATIAVTSSQDELPIDTHNGTCTLREAITAANTDQKVDACAAGLGNMDTILLQPMAYALSDAVKVTSVITIQGKESADIDPKTGKPKRTTLMRSSADPKKFNLVIVKEGAVLNIDTMLLTGGDTDAGVGGAVKVDAGQLTAVNVAFVGNKALQGGAIYAFNSKVALSKVLFNGNFAKDGGGAVRSFGGSLTVTEGQFEKNSSGTSNGGAVFADSTALLIDTGLFTQNSTGVNGGALFVSGPSAPQLASIVNSTFYKNSAGGIGGAIYSLLNGKSLNVVNTALIENSANEGGAAYVAGKANFVNTTLGKNTAAQNGGAIVAAGTAQITFTHATIAENAAKLSGGGIFAESNAKVEILGTVITGNTAADSAKDYAGPFTSKGYNFISQVPTNFGQFNADSTDVVGKFGGTAPFEMGQVLLGLLGSQKTAVWYYPLVMSEGLSAVNKDTTDYCKYFNLCVAEKMVDGQAMCVQDIQPLLADQVGTLRDGQCDSGSIEYVVAVVEAKPEGSVAPSQDASHPTDTNSTESHPASGSNTDTDAHPVVTAAGTNTSTETSTSTATAHAGVIESTHDVHGTTDAHTTTDAHAQTKAVHAAEDTSHVEAVVAHPGGTDARATDTHVAKELSHVAVESPHETGHQVSDHSLASAAAPRNDATAPAQVFEKPVSSESWMDSVLRTNVKPLTSTGTIDQFLGSATTASTSKGVHDSAAATFVAARDGQVTAAHPNLVPTSHSGSTAAGVASSHDGVTHGSVSTHATEGSAHAEKAATHALGGLQRATENAAAPAKDAVGHPILGSEKVAKEVDAQNTGSWSVDIPAAEAKVLDSQKTSMEDSGSTQGEMAAVIAQADMPQGYTQGEIVAVNNPQGAGTTVAYGQPNLPSMGSGNENFQNTPAEVPAAAAAPAAAGASGGCSLIR